MLSRQDYKTVYLALHPKLKAISGKRGTIKMTIKFAVESAVKANTSFRDLRSRLGNGHVISLVRTLLDLNIFASEEKAALIFQELWTGTVDVLLFFC